MHGEKVKIENEVWYVIDFDVCDGFICQLLAVNHIRHSVVNVGICQYEFL
jgi:hypothetical protein